MHHPLGENYNGNRAQTYPPLIPATNSKVFASVTNSETQETFLELFRRMQKPPAGSAGIRTGHLEHDRGPTGGTGPIPARPMPLAFADPHRHPQDLERPDEMPNLATELLRRGGSGEDSQKLLGGDFLRLFSEVWSNQ